MSPALLASGVLLAPLAAAAVIALGLRRAPGAATAVALLAAVLVAGGSLLLALGPARDFTASVELLRLGTFGLSLGIKFDDLAALLLAIVGIIGLCVHVFSVGYMHEDPDRARYFGGLAIFMFSMLGIVFADSLLMLFIFWELVGFSSWLLINHHFDRAPAAEASAAEPTEGPPPDGAGVPR